MQKLKLLVSAALLAAPFVAYAESADCSGVSRWNSDKDYKSGDRVWYHGWGPYRLYACNKDKCHGAGQSEPGNSDTWKLVGNCSKDPS